VDVQQYWYPSTPKRRSFDMTTRSRREIVHFKHPFLLKGVDRLLSPGAYQVITDEEMIEGLSFASFRRIATLIMVPGIAPRTSSTEMISINPEDLLEAQSRDASGTHE
jgi:hypothetical protein